MLNEDRFVPALNGYDPKQAEEDLKRKHKNILEECEDRGQKSGQMDIPKNDLDIDPFEDQIKAKYQQIIEEFHENQHGFLSEIFDKKYTVTLQELNDREEGVTIEKTELERENRYFRKKGEEIKKQYDDEKRNILNNEALKLAIRDCEESKKKMDNYSAIIGRNEPYIQFKPFWLYVIILGILGICEIPLNYQVFKYFREIPLLTLIMSCSIVFAVPLLSHFSGLFLKQRNEHVEYPYFATVSFLIIIGLSITTAFLRHGYMIKRINNIDNSLPIDLFAFFVISILLFFVGMLASFFAHEESHKLVQLYNDLHRKRLLKEDLEKEIQIEKNRLEIKFSQQKDYLESEHHNNEEVILGKNQKLRNLCHNYAGRYNQSLSYFQGKEHEIDSYYHEAIQIYRGANVQCRKTDPPKWKDLTSLEFRFDRYKIINVDEI
jgi:hypothetical protein